MFHSILFSILLFFISTCYLGQICIMLCADHGPCVSGAHNTIVTARAGKDLVSSLVSGKQTVVVLLSSFPMMWI